MSKLESLLDDAVKCEPIEFPLSAGLDHYHGAKLVMSSGTTRSYTVNHPSTTTIVTILPPTPPHTNSLTLTTNKVNSDPPPPSQ